MGFPVDMVDPIPYLAAQVKERWGGAKVIHLPTDTDFEDDLSLLIDVVRMTNRVPGWEGLIPKYYQRMLRRIYLADFLNIQPLLGNTCCYD